MTHDEAMEKAAEAIEQAQVAANDGRVDDSKALCIVAAEWRLLALTMKHDGDTTARNLRQRVSQMNAAAMAAIDAHDGVTP